MQDRKSITWTDSNHGAVLIEPDVTYGQLLAELEARRVRTLMPLCPRRSDSVLASYLNGEPCTAPRFQYDMLSPITSAEFALGDGESIRVGDIMSVSGLRLEPGGTERTAEIPFTVFSKFVEKLGVGLPGVAEMCLWATIRCDPVPEHEQLLFVQAPSLSDLTGTAHHLIEARLADNLFILNSLNLACLLRLDLERISPLRAALPPWALIFTVTGYGDEAREMFADKRAAVEAAGFEASTSLRGASLFEVKDLLRAASDEPHWKQRLRGDCRLLSFRVPPSNAPGLLDRIRALADKHGFPVSELGVYAQPQLRGASCLLEFDFNLSADDVARAKTIEAIKDEARRQTSGLAPLSTEAVAVTG